MKLFAELYRSLLLTKDRDLQSIYLQSAFEQSHEIDRLYFTKLILHGMDYPIISTKALLKYAIEFCTYPQWLWDQSYAEVKDWNETISLCMAQTEIKNSNLSFHVIIDELIALPVKQNHIDWIKKYWTLLSPDELWFFNKLIVGGIKSLDIHDSIEAIFSKETKIPMPLLRLRFLLYDWTALVSILHTPITPEEESLDFSSFIIPEYLESIHSIGPIENFIMEPFIFGDRKLLFKTSFRSIFYSVEGDWQSVNMHDLPWLSIVPPQSNLEIILSKEKVYITDILYWNNIKYNGTRLEKREIFEQCLQVFKEYPILETQPIEIIEAEKNKIKIPKSGLILKNKYDPTLWYRLKPTPHSLWSSISYVEIKNAPKMEFLITVSILNEAEEWLPIAKLSSEDIPVSPRTHLFYWLQNNAIQKFGPVRTVRTGMAVNISFDRIEVNKKNKAGLKLVNVKFINFQLTGTNQFPIATQREIIDLQVLENL